VKHLALLIAALALTACGAAEKKETPKPDIVHVYGWIDADDATGPGLRFMESPDAPGFLMRCVSATKALTITVANPVDAAPQAGERVALQLGAVQYDGFAQPAGSEDAKLIVTTIPLTGPLLVALGDSRTARLTYRESMIDAGVDDEGLILAFARRCATATDIMATLE
jgi:hypothetical protein